jgi:hypothetical protein
MSRLAARCAAATTATACVGTAAAPGISKGARRGRIAGCGREGIGLGLGTLLRLGDFAPL